MAARGTAARSASGASMSQYDVEVEKRLKVLESENAWLKQKLEEHVSTGRTAPSPAADLSEKVELLITVLKMNPGLNIEKLSKGKL